MSSFSHSRLPIHITGWGAVSPAGWSAAALADAVEAGTPLPFGTEQRVPGAPERRFRRVPPAPGTPDWMKQPRLRRTTVAARHAVHAAVQALGEERLPRLRAGGQRIGTVFCTMSGCVQFSRRFYSEVLSTPLLASPILFPETVYNAPASHVSSLLGSPEINYTLVGDSAQFLAGLDLAAQWLDDHDVDACLVIAAEESDWVSEEALLLFERQNIPAEGAAAVLLEKASATPSGEGTPTVILQAVTEAQAYDQFLNREEALRQVQRALAPLAEPGALLCDNLNPGQQHTHQHPWREWSGPRLSPVPVLGEGFSITSGWQTVLACEQLRRGRAPQALICTSGLTQQAAGAALRVQASPDP